MDESRFTKGVMSAWTWIRLRKMSSRFAIVYTKQPFCIRVTPRLRWKLLDETVYKALKACGKLQQEEFFTTWITRILLNECSSERKRRGRMAPLETLPETAVEQFDALPLKEAIRRLPQELKQVIIPRYFAGYTLRETADILQLPLGTVATRQRRALALLRLELSEEGSYGS
jgi:RNA polymerase sigma-70 factor (ECF subfamily)